jgi:hypothetical protein
MRPHFSERSAWGQLGAGGAAEEGDGPGGARAGQPAFVSRQLGGGPETKLPWDQDDQRQLIFVVWRALLAKVLRTLLSPH